MSDSPRSTDTAANRREHYRVEYPVADRPAFLSGELRGEVSDCSETGVKVYLSGNAPADKLPAVGETIAAMLRFARQETDEIEGTVLRCDTEILVLKLDRHALPFRRILKEQWRLRALYPWRKGQ